MLARLKQIYFWLSLGRGHKGLVLDVGSGNSPHPRANVLCDRYLGDTGHRHSAPLIEDRPLVVADVCALPFRTGMFDFVFLRHVLEHLEPAQIPSALSEITRVGRAGYVESPSPVCEMLMADPYHKTFVELRDGMLVFTPKQESFPFPPVARVFLEWRKKSRSWQRFIQENQVLLSTAVLWHNRIPYRIESPRLFPATYETTATELGSICNTAVGERVVSSRARAWAKTFFRLMFETFRRFSRLRRLRG